MATIENFEDLEVWQISMDLCTEVYRITNSQLFSKDFGLKDQIRRAAVSVPSNISEGYERNGKNQFLYFLSIAKGSCGEVRTQLQIAYELNYLFKDEFVVLKQKCESTSRQLSGFMKYLNSYKGNKK
jgi:four helix bundle protein